MERGSSAGEAGRLVRRPRAPWVDGDEGPRQALPTPSSEPSHPIGHDALTLRSAMTMDGQDHCGGSPYEPHTATACPISSNDKASV